MSIQPFLILLILSGTLLIVSGTWAYIRSRKSRTRTGGVKKVRFLKAYRQQSPLFYQIMVSVQKNKGLKRLLQHEDVSKALQVLDSNARRRRLKSVHPQSSMLNLTTDSESANRKVRAAMTTVVRSVYFDDELRRILPAELDQELDQYLDNLTG